MKFVVISDLHTGSATIAQDFCVGDSSSAVKKGYMDDLRHLVEKEELEADYLIVTSDITNRSMYDEFELAAKRIKECAEAFKIEESKIFLFLVTMTATGKMKKHPERIMNPTRLL